MIWPSRQRWETLLQSAGAAKPADAWYRRLNAAYAEPQRFYHNQNHIAECLAEFDRARQLSRDPHALELALWFHDAVYDPKASDNEEQSALLAKSCLAELGVSETLAQTVADLVMVTKTHQRTRDTDAVLVTDIDLSILGREMDRFLEYEQQIRSEYAWVPKDIFASKRAQILRGFLARNRIFGTKSFYERYEATARENLKMSISMLEQVSP